MPWQIVDGIHFRSITLTGYKLSPAVDDPKPLFATLRGPFSSVTDEFGQTSQRGVPISVIPYTARLLATLPFEKLFVVSNTPVMLELSDPRLTKILPKENHASGKGTMLYSPARSLNPRMMTTIFSDVAFLSRSVRRLGKSSIRTPTAPIL